VEEKQTLRLVSPISRSISLSSELDKRLIFSAKESSEINKELRVESTIDSTLTVESKLRLELR
jgi:hypothetical protein